MLFIFLKKEENFLTHEVTLENLKYSNTLLQYESGILQSSGLLLPTLTSSFVSSSDLPRPRAGAADPGAAHPLHPQ